MIVSCKVKHRRCRIPQTIQSQSLRQASLCFPHSSLFVEGHFFLIQSQPFYTCTCCESTGALSMLKLMSTSILLLASHILMMGTCTRDNSGKDKISGEERKVSSSVTLLFTLAAGRAQIPTLTRAVSMRRMDLGMPFSSRRLANVRRGIACHRPITTISISLAEGKMRVE